MPRFFQPILAGATLKERLIGCAGALLGVLVTGIICAWIFGADAHLPLIVAPVGASAVLLFAVPASPLAQPWPIIGGNTISALVGVTVATLVGDPMIATGVAVALAIAVMSVTRCLHPPGGAAALTAVVGGPAVASAGFLFPLVPVGINSLVLVGLGIAFHRLTRRNYPHRAQPAAPNPHKTEDALPYFRIGFNGADIDAALAEYNEALDIDREDLEQLLRTVELKALSRSHSEATCADIMSRDVITVRDNDTPETARHLLLDHRIRTLPVVDETGRLAGTVGLRELVRHPESVTLPVNAAAITASASDPVSKLLPVLTDGVRHCVVIVDEDRHVIGIVSQTDLLAGLARSLSMQAPKAEALIHGSGI